MALSQPPHGFPDLWGGFECSTVRLGARFRDQFIETGHANRIRDLDAAAALGIRTLRYPVLWETISPLRSDTCEWNWTDARLSRLRELGIRPVVGLVHHGSGPSYTSLLDPGFAEGLAVHAGRVAARYPWVTDYTPVNEPLTTARFSALYGHWYPHRTNQADFLRALVNQCKAVLLSMRAIRRVTPEARLIQTEDIGKTFSVAKLAYQANYENERRWLSLDLLDGRVGPSHPWHARLLSIGIARSDLDLLAEGEGAPDLIGVNHYLTSERYLDTNAMAYPSSLRGGNGRHRYADAEAVRIDLLAGTTGPEARLAEVWHRYRRPLAVTEAHHGCTRDEQLRWLQEVWEAACNLRRAGCPVEAVTVWALLGAVDWNSLLVNRHGFYEPGAFDTRSQPPRLTALGRAASDLAIQGHFEHPVLQRPGWWRRLGRHYQPSLYQSPPQEPGRPLVVLGAQGPFTDEVLRVCAWRGLDTLHIPCVMDVGDTLTFSAGRRPWAVLDASTLELSAKAVRYPGATLWTDPYAAQAVAAACAAGNLPLLGFTSNLVFDGSTGPVHAEDAHSVPLSLFGTSQAQAEGLVAKAHPAALQIRTGCLMAASETLSLPSTLHAAFVAGEFLPTLPSNVTSLSYVPDLIHAALDLLIDGERGIWHLANQGETTWTGLADRMAATMGVACPPLTRLCGGATNTALTSVRGLMMPSLDSAIDRFVRDRLAFKDQTRGQAAE
ncbi:sugar nucleotide-binding protein [Methylobacterium sp. CM6247]